MSTENLVRAKRPNSSDAIDNPVEGVPQHGVPQPAHPSAPLPRTPHRRKRKRSERGLPPRPEIERLANVYFGTQLRLWPQLAKSSDWATESPQVISSMADSFIARHGGLMPTPCGLPMALNAPETRLAGAYCRFSCDNSESTSIDDQLVNCLTKARSESRFTPWEYIYADYSMTGLDASRQGYTSYKSILASEQHRVETTYIDDFTRASRDELEWWKLATLTRRLQKRLIGSSDNFDLNSGDWEVTLTLYGLFSRLFIRSLRQKVGRGMRGAARRGTCLGKPSLGFTRRQKLDPSGKALTSSDGLPVYEPCIDPNTAPDLLKLFQLFVDQNWPLLKICRHFNETEVDHWNRWTDRGIRQLLKNPAAIGVFIWNRTRREFDIESNKTIVVKNPRKAWEVEYYKDRAIVPIQLWRDACRKFSEGKRRNRKSGKPPTRNSIRPTTLFSGTLFCECCRSELKLIRSSKQYQQLGSTDAVSGANNCRLKSSKSVRVIEECLLKYLRDTLLTDNVVEGLVTRANEWLKIEAARPAPNLAPLEKRCGKLRKQIERLVRSIASSDDDDVAASCRSEIKRLQAELTPLQGEVRDLQARVGATVVALDLDSAKQELNNLRSLLQADISIAGRLIRELTGPISIREENLPGKRRSRWIATFTPRFDGLVPHLFRQQLPELLLSSMSGPDRRAVEVVIDKLPQYEARAEEFRKMRDSGASVSAIAAAHGLPRPAVAAALAFADTGIRPDYSGQQKRQSSEPNRSRRCKYKAIAAEVARLFDEEHCSFNVIAQKLGVGCNTVHRAYNHLHPERARKAVESGLKPASRRHPVLSRKVFQVIEALHRQGKPVAEIAMQAQCSVNTVRRHLQKLQPS